MDDTDAPVARWEDAKSEGIALLDRGKFDDAVTSLRRAVAADATGESEALLGLAEFHRERYVDAADHYAKALAVDGDQPEWVSMLAACRANTIAKVEVPVPDVVHFDRDTIIGPPPTSRLPVPPAERHGPTLWQRFRYLVGHAAGSVGGGIMHALTNLLGRRYRGDVWTTWYRTGVYVGIFRLAYMRNQLNARNLRSTYPSHTHVAFQPDGLEPPRGVTHFRTADGSWNNFDNPKEGAAGTRFPRNVDNSAIRAPSDEELLTPNPRTISRKLLGRSARHGRGPVPQPAGGVVDPVPEPRLDHPRREHRRPTTSRSHWTRTTPLDGDTGRRRCSSAAPNRIRPAGTARRHRSRSSTR